MRRFFIQAAAGAAMRRRRSTRGHGCRAGGGFQHRPRRARQCNDLVCKYVS